jgi:ABC-type lipoprotein release transport system permease subunit
MVGTASLALLASVYPAWSAARISPLKAMQKD